MWRLSGVYWTAVPSRPWSDQASLNFVTGSPPFDSYTFSLSAITRFSNPVRELPLSKQHTMEKTSEYFIKAAVLYLQLPEKCGLSTWSPVLLCSCRIYSVMTRGKSRSYFRSTPSSRWGGQACEQGPGSSMTESGRYLLKLDHNCLPRLA